MASYNSSLCDPQSSMLNQPNSIAEFYSIHIQIREIRNLLLLKESDPGPNELKPSNLIEKAVDQLSDALTSLADLTAQFPSKSKGDLKLKSDILHYHAFVDRQHFIDRMIDQLCADIDRLICSEST
jgi:hypothetical protein